MAKRYNLGNSSDMRRFEKDLNQQILSSVEQQLYSQTYEVTCPHCQQTVSVPAGENPCPACGKTIDLNLNITYN